jgi:hypothetical protein
MKFLKYFLLGTPLLLGSCGPGSATDDTADSAEASTLETDCESFCGPAVECSEAYAADWEFDSQDDCIDNCVLFTNSKVIFLDDPICDETTRAMWVCAGKIETCEDFALFESAAFGMSGIGGKPCADELYKFAQTCNG